jgi:hypothetical protein
VDLECSTGKPPGGISDEWSFSRDEPWFLTIRSRVSMAAMRKGSIALVTTSLVLMLACGSNSATTQPAAPTATTPYGYPPPGYPPPGYATAQPTPYPAPYPSPAPAPAPAPTGSAQLATPGLLALPCQSDSACGLHHCNTQYGKCAFPCQTAADCLTGNCIMGVCLPGGGS